ncbi:hypothetical protein JG688_00011848, partial [Phytophthora aleatoria]
LTDGDREIVQSLREAGKSVRAISRQGKRSRDTVERARCYGVVLPTQDVSLSSRRGSTDGCFARRPQETSRYRSPMPTATALARCERSGAWWLALIGSCTQRWITRSL